MFEIVTQLLIQFIDLIPGLIGLYIIFDFMGSLLFGKQ